MRGLISRPKRTFDRRQLSAALPILWSALVTLLVASPWLLEGYLFGTDWPGPRRFDFPTVLSSSAPLEAILAAASRIASGEITGKVFVIGTLFVAALVAFRAAPTEGFVPKAVASAIYVFNPFVFGRLHYGQMFLLAGYALLPWVALELRRLLVTPSLTAGLLVAVSAATVGIVSTHLFLVSAILAGALVVSHGFAAHAKFGYAKRVGPSLLAAAVTTLALSSYWVLPLLIGHGPIATAIAGFGQGDLAAFAAVPDDRVGLLPNVLGLYGFWAENTGRFTSMKVFVPFWPVILAVILALCAIGTVATFTKRRDPLRPWVAGLLLAAVIAVVLEMGVSHPLTRGLVTWLDTTFPIYRGMRDAGKWAALLAFVYSQLLALGAAAVIDWLDSRRPARIRPEWLVGVATGVLLAVPLYYGNGMLYGMHGEIVPSQYPAGWYAADRMLASDARPGRTLFLPWHEYLTLSFVRNENNAVACPAASFFSTPVLVSANPEVEGIAPPTAPDQVAVTNLVRAGEQADWARELATLHMKYILLAREVDWQGYAYLDSQPNLRKVADFGSILLYRNSLVV